MKKSPLIAALILLTGCAGAGPTFDASQTPHSASKATLVIYRPAAFIGSMASPTTFVDGVEKCDLSNGSFYYATVPAGSAKIEYSILEHSARSSFQIKVSGGHKYYVRITPDAGTIMLGEAGVIGGVIAASDNKGLYNVQLIDASQALNELQSIKQAISCK